MVSLALWLVFTKSVKLLPHFYRYPTDVRFIPVAIIFGYLHGFIKIYALFTLNVTTWGGRDTGQTEEKVPFLQGSSFEALGRAGRLGQV
ncbi:MAG: hypothetical protein M1830_006147 [Pleopsidium flavum]|nr:MAG: hypothetical protein M1830_006147 [Pleopsidium flavum]